MFVTKDQAKYTLDQANSDIARVRANRKTTTLKEQLADPTQEIIVSLFGEESGLTLFIDSGPIDPTTDKPECFVLTNEMRQVAMYESTKSEDQFTLPKKIWQDIFDCLVAEGFTSTKTPAAGDH